MSKETNNSGGIGIYTILFLIFLVLKLTNQIDWSWWWVFSPFWLPLVVVIAMWLIIMILTSFKN